jgi:hypothetical protein
MTRNELSDLFTPIYDEFSQIAAAGVQVQHPKIADVIVDTTKDFKYDTISGLGVWNEVSEDSDEGLDHFIIGYEGTITPLKYRKYFYVTFEVNEQMEYASLKAKITKAQALGRGAPARLESLVATVLNNGFTTAWTGDGLYLFYNTHYKNPEETGTTYDNLLSGSFSHDNLEEAEKQISANMFDLDGLPMALYAGRPTIVFPPALRGPVDRVLNARAGEQPDTTVRNMNRFAGKFDFVEMEWLGSKLGGSDTAWYIIYPELKNLKLIKSSDAPQYASWIDNLKQRYYFDGWLWAAAGAND